MVRRREFGHDFITDGFYYPPTSGLHGLLHDLNDFENDLLRRGVTKRFKYPGASGYVGKEDGDVLFSH